MPGTDSAQGHRADEGRGNLCPTKHTKSTKSTKVSEHEAIDINFQSSCSSCPSWLLELSSVFKARSGECDCQLYRVLRAGRRTRCPSYMGRVDVGLSRPAGRSWRPACATDILSVAAGGRLRHRVANPVWRSGRRLGLGGKRGHRDSCPEQIGASHFRFSLSQHSPSAPASSHLLASANHRSFPPPALPLRRRRCRARRCRGGGRFDEEHAAA